MLRAAGVTIGLALLYRSGGPAGLGILRRRGAAQAFFISSTSCVSPRAVPAAAALPRPPRRQPHPCPRIASRSPSFSVLTTAMSDSTVSELDQFATHTSVDYHHLSPTDAAAIRQALLDWYRPNRRKLPWRGDPPPYDGSTAGINVGNGKSANGSKRPVGKKKDTKDEKQPTISRFFAAKAGTKKGSATKQGQDEGDTSSTSSTAATTLSSSASSSTITSDDELPPQQISAYGTWVSEIMLQQTRVEAVIPFYLKWMQSFPTVHDLASATEEQVNSHWAGLGFYRRARMLHSGAKMIVDKYGGDLPKTVDELMTIDGIGRYTASAISSIAHNQCVPVVDGNVCRVLARLTGVANHIKAPIFKDKLGWDLARQIVEAGDGQHAGEVNQALMELGATYCAPNGSGIDDRDPLREFYRSTRIGREMANRLQQSKSMDIDEFVSATNAARGKEGCKLCDPEGISTVLFDISQALESSESRSDDLSATTGHAAFPTAPPKKAKREEVLALAALRCVMADEDGNSQVEKWLMVKRPKSGLLANQWEFPSCCVWNSADAKKEKKTGASSAKKSKKKDEKQPADIPTIDPVIRKDALDSFLCEIKSSLVLDRTNIRDSIEHIFSHVRHTYHIEHGEVGEDDVGSLATVSAFTSDGREARFMSEDDMKTVGITSGVKKVLKAVKASGAENSMGGKTSIRKEVSQTSPSRGKKQKVKK